MAAKHYVAESSPLGGHGNCGSAAACHLVDLNKIKYLYCSSHHCEMNIFFCYTIFARHLHDRKMKIIIKINSQSYRLLERLPVLRTASKPMHN